tara:strand:+ start:362 stop:988 length:627 start_codon:yes stop_codon:yes gene_type:complete
MKNISKKVLNNIILPCFGILLIVYLFVVIFNVKTDKEDLSWQELLKGVTIGKVVDISGAANGSNAILEFSIDGKTYEKLIESTYVRGDKFKVEYRIKNHKDSKVLRDYPLFVEGENTKLVIGKLITYNSSIFRSSKFDYWVDKKKYERRQYEKENSKELYPNVEEGQLFVIEYWKQDPRRSIIYLDKPIDYISKWWKYKIDKNGKIIK